jgi:hypothetical protein
MYCCSGPWSSRTWMKFGLLLDAAELTNDVLLDAGQGQDAGHGQRSGTWHWSPSMSWPFRPNVPHNERAAALSEYNLRFALPTKARRLDA